MEPLISIRFQDRRRTYLPGEMLRCAYQVDAVGQTGLQAIEASVLWYTEGKGDEDMSVHYFERRVAGDVEEGDLQQLWQFSTPLPNSPLSYNGVIVKVRWCVRVRVFLGRGKGHSSEGRFQLGKVPRGKAVIRKPAEPVDADSELDSPLNWPSDAAVKAKSAV